MRIFRLLGAAFVVAGCAGDSATSTPASATPAATFDERDVFVGGVDGYPIYRIPALLETPTGALLAFAEGRRNLNDTGDIDIVVKRSDDGGATWSQLAVVVDQGGDVAGNPCPVIDRATGAVLLVYDTNPAKNDKDRRVVVVKSTDDGRSWSAPLDVTGDVKPATWSWYAVGPGRGIQLADGRYVIPADHHDDATNVSASHVIWSDDGVAWHLGGSIGPDTDEAQVAQLTDGSLLMSARDLSPSHRRAFARSSDRGQTWSETTRDPAIADPSCEGSLLQTSWGLLFSNPDSEGALDRKRLTVRVSHDGGATWPASKVLHEGPAAYSSLAALPDARIGCLYETGEKFSFAPYERITLARFTKGWLE